MIRQHQEQIGEILRHLEMMKSEVVKGWNDNNQKKFFHNHLTPLGDSLNRYRISVNNYYDQLNDAMKRINSLVDPFKFGGCPHIRERER